MYQIFNGVYAIYSSIYRFCRCCAVFNIQRFFEKMLRPVKLLLLLSVLEDFNDYKDIKLVLRVVHMIEIVIEYDTRE